MLRIAHLTSVHPRHDTRIFLKMCASLTANNYEVILVVADGKGDEDREGVRILDVGVSKSRLDRIMNASIRVFSKAVKLKADLYHLHDPELMPFGLLLKLAGKRVIYDSHEDLPKQIMSKPYLARPIRRFVADVLRLWEWVTAKSVDAVISATPAIHRSFIGVSRRATIVNNYPLEDELWGDSDWENRPQEVCYVGGIARIRGLLPLVDALAMTTTGVILNLVGNFSEKGLAEEVSSSPGWDSVRHRGYLDRNEVRNVMRKSIAGLVTYLPAPNHMEAQPNKLFEYMAAGIPVIASHFPLWREIVEENKCGICVDPESPEQIASALDWMVKNPDYAREMGARGRAAVLARYNWKVEAAVLVKLYESILYGR